MKAKSSLEFFEELKNADPSLLGEKIDIKDNPLWQSMNHKPK